MEDLNTMIMDDTMGTITLNEFNDDETLEDKPVLAKILEKWPSIELKRDKIYIKDSVVKYDVMEDKLNDAGLDISVKRLKELLAETQKPKKSTSQFITIPHREFSEVDNKVYEDKVKKLMSPDGSLVWMVKDNTAKGNIWHLTTNTETLPGYDPKYFQNCIDTCNEMLSKGLSAASALSKIPCVLFERHSSGQFGGVVGKYDGDENLLNVSYKPTLRKIIFDGNIAKDVFSPQNKHCNEIITYTQPTPFTNDPDEIALAYCDLEPYSYLGMDSFKGSYTEQEVLNECPTPNWDSWFSKFEPREREIILAYIWTIFDCNYRGNEALWIFDEGGTGKSTFIDAITGIFKKVVYMSPGHDSVATSQNGLHNQINDTFFTGSIYDKRLLIVPECTNDRFIEESIIHAITGGDSVNVNQKFEKTFSYKPHLRLFIMSNIWPKIDTNKENETRRLIPIQSRFDYSVKNEIKGFKDLLIAESTNLLKKAHYYYDKINVDGSVISRNEHRERICDILPKSETQIYYTDIFEKSDNPDAFISTEDCIKAVDDFNSCHHKRLRNDAREISSFITKQLGGIPDRKQIKGVRTRGFKGIKCNFGSTDTGDTSEQYEGDIEDLF